MAIVNHEDWGISERGKSDAARHRKKVDKAIRESVADVIADENIITQRKDGQKVRVPIKGLRDYRFIYGRDGDGKGGGGVGQGPGKKGDVIAKRKIKGDGSEPGAGDSKGENYMEVEVDIEYLLQIMFQDLGLPWLEEKTKIEEMIPLGWKFETITKKGIFPRLHLKRTLHETMKRLAQDVGEIMEETGCSEDDAYRSLIQSKYDLIMAIDIINDGLVDRSIDPLSAIMVEDDDFRYQQIEEDVIPQSNAVIISMRDVSGSMDIKKRYLTRSLLFWFSEFLKKMYDNVEHRFIVHTTEADIVDEQTFFNLSSDGGTFCFTAFKKALELIEAEYPSDMWNVYIFYASDGEDFNSGLTLEWIDRCIEISNMVSYAEVYSEGFGFVYPTHTLIESIKKHYNLDKSVSADIEFYKDDEKHFVAGIIKDKTHIWPYLKNMLFGPKRK